MYRRALAVTNGFSEVTTSRLRHAALAGLVSLLPVVATMFATTASAQVRGIGASFPSKVYERWARTYEQQNAGAAVSYKATGSGDGVKQISARAVEFGGSDTPLPADELTKRKLVQVPMLIGGIVPVVRLPGIGANRLQLSGDVLADILAARIAKWNDARIVAQNPGVALPALRIQRIVRADRSGTTEGFTRYLSEVSPAFKTEIGASQAPKWPGQVVTAEGNDGMVKALAETDGGIAYVSYDRVVKDELAAVRLVNGAGVAVAASEAGFRAAILDSDVSRAGNDLASLMNRPASGAWPITQTSFVLFDAEPADADRAAQGMRFLYWCLMHGDDLTRGTGFAPLPVNLQARLTARFAGVRAKDGKAPQYMNF
jgi:phosphate transport system substrate-binding protein